jgi:RNA polymerase-associated protein CTR9/transcription factor SPN1
MTEQSETLPYIETDSQMEEKRRKLNPRPDSEDNDNPVDSKKRKLTPKNDVQTFENTSTNEESEEIKDSDSGRADGGQVSEIKENLILSKSTKKTRSKSRSNIKSKSKSKSKSKPRIRLISESVKKSASKVKEAFLSESSYSLRPRKEIDYSKAFEEENQGEKLVSETGKSALMLDKEDASDLSFKCEKSEENRGKDSPKQDESGVCTGSEERQNQNENALTIGEEDKAAVEEAADKGQDKGNDYKADLYKSQDSAAIREEVLEELKELQGKNFFFKF